MTTIFLKGTKLVSLPDGNCEIVPDVPETPTKPTKPDVSSFKLGPAIINNVLVGLKSGDYMPQNPDKPHSLQQVISFKDEVWRFEIRPGEVWKGSNGKSGDLNNKNRERSELYLKNSNFKRDTDIWINYKFMIPEGGDTLKPTEDGFMYIGQIHAAEDKGDVSSTPPVGLLLSAKNGKYFVTVTSASATDRIHTVKPKAITRGTFEVERGVWIDITIKVRFNPTKGLLQVWKGKQNVVNLENEGIGYNDETGPYWKFGAYRQPANETFVIYYANMTVSKDGKTSLWSRVENPLPIA
ncbi:hypothetical protein FEM33_01530 [Dyadobacter flavalbus]|uniref:Polysaccharide lyase family 7 protein n=1 Tax=Dyadobacter flavalbus TaxID=2579942 RepID=A0A5M8R1A7_9BACT|nr:heparin lyase I family protein [Dyadobacter flavalbus]KAA6441441.1 hypothetical protein FEM33_01530 [Dyadobacter flavalbus]